MYKKLKLYYRTCPCCFSKSYTSFFSKKNFEKIDGFGNFYLIDKFYVICKKCNLVFTNPTVNSSVFDKIYERTIVGSFRKNSNKNISNLKKFKYFCNLVEKKVLDKKKILEIGCGQGTLLENIVSKFKIKNKDVFAIEPSKKIYHYLKKNSQFNIRNCFLKDLKKNSFYDFMILDNVFEHFDNPNYALKKIYTLLSNKGYIYISVPNVLKLKFDHEDPMNHTCNYYKLNLINILKNNNFRIIKLHEKDTLINLLAIRHNYKKKFFINFNKDKNKFQFLKKKLEKNKKRIIKQDLKIRKTGQRIKRKNEKIMIFGSGNYSLELLKKLKINKNIIGYVDNNSLYHGLIRNGFKVYSLNQTKNIVFDRVIIASKAYEKEILLQLLKNKIQKNKIIRFS